MNIPGKTIISQPLQWRIEKARARLDRVDFLAFAVVVTFFISGIATLPRYGISFDEGLGNMFFGERYLHYLAFQDTQYLDFEREFPYHEYRPLNLFDAPYRLVPHEFPALADIASAATMYAFAYKLKWMDPVDGYHAFNILIASFFLLVLYFFFSPRLGKLPALLGVVFLAVYPRFWGDMHFNPKDVAETCFFGMAVMAYVSWFERPQILRASLFAVLFACALAVKANALFLPLILLCGVWRWFPIGQQLRANLIHVRRYIFHYLWMLILTALVYFLSWPYLYDDPARIALYFQYIFGQGGRSGGAGWSAQPLQMVLATMPETVLAALLLGCGFLLWVSVKRKPQPRDHWLLVVWCATPILRSSMPNTVNFDGIRHFLEFLPAAVLIAGVGAASLFRTVAWRGRVWAWAAALVMAVVFFLNIVIIHVQFHPMQYIYFNSLTGGLPGGARIFGEGEATDYWAVSYRQGIDWLNANAPENSALVVPVAKWVVDLSAQLWLRPDIDIIFEDRIDDELPYRAVYVMTITRPSFYTPLNHELRQRLTPAHALVIQGVPVMEIYRYSE